MRAVPGRAQPQCAGCGADQYRWERAGAAGRPRSQRGVEHSGHPGDPQAAPYLDSREVRWSAVVGSGLMGGEVTKAAAFAQFLLQ